MQPCLRRFIPIPPRKVQRAVLSVGCCRPMARGLKIQFRASLPTAKQATTRCSAADTISSSAMNSTKHVPCGTTRVRPGPAAASCANERACTRPLVSTSRSLRSERAVGLETPPLPGRRRGCDDGAVALARQDVLRGLAVARAAACILWPPLAAPGLLLLRKQETLGWASCRRGYCHRCSHCSRTSALHRRCHLRGIFRRRCNGLGRWCVGRR